MKFSLHDGDGERTSTADISGFTATALTCPDSAAAADEIDFVTSGRTSLRYDSTEQQFIQNWKVPSGRQDSCYLVTVTFADDSTLSAFFRLRP